MIEIATVDDAKEILQLQKLAYLSEAAIYNDYTIAPLMQTIQDTELDFQQQTILKTMNGDRIVGSVRGYVKDGTGYISKLIVHPNVQNQGIGTRLIHAIEENLGQVKRYELFTGYRSKRNIHLYTKLGYVTFRTETINDKTTLLYMEKLVT